MVNLRWKDQLFGITSICLNGYNNSNLETDLDSPSDFSCFSHGLERAGKIKGWGKDKMCHVIRK